MTESLFAVPDRMPSLPGMDRRSINPGFVEKAARRQLGALADADRLTEDHGLLVASILSLAASADMSMGRIAGVQAQKLLLEAMDKLPPLVPDAGGTEWTELVTALSAPAEE